MARWMRVIGAVVLGLLMVCASVRAGEAPAAVQQFQLKEYVDHDWSHELVFFALDKAAVQDGLTLVDPAGKPCLSQIVPGKDGARIAFMADLPAGTTRTWSLVREAAGPAPTTGLKLEEAEGRIRLQNELVGVEVPTAKGGSAGGPISAIKTRSGRWVGGGQLVARRKITSYTARVTARGPVYGEVECRYEFEGGKVWTIVLRVIAGEPVVTVDETFDLGDASRWELNLGTGLGPDRVAYRNCSPMRGDPSNAVLVKPLPLEQGGSPFLLCPWLLWWQPSAVSFMILFKAEPGIDYVYDPKKKATLRLETKKPVGTLEGAEKSADDKKLMAQVGEKERPAPGVPGEDVLFVAAGHAGDWARPGDNGPTRCVPLRVKPKGAVYLDLQLGYPARKWIIGASTIARTVVPDSELPEAQRYMIKYCETPLESVHEMKLEWAAEDPADQRWLLIDEADVPDVCRRLKGHIPNHRYMGQVYYGFLCDMQGPMRKRLRESVTGGLRGSIEVFTENIEGRGRDGVPIRRPSGPAYNHHVTMHVMAVLVGADLAFGGHVFTPEELARIRAKLAFLAYKIGSPDFYSLQRNWRANPNMTTMRHSVIGMVGCLLPKHPKSHEWFELGLSEIKRQITHWIGPNGGWLECPHYQTLLSEALLMLKAAHTVGYSDLLYDERLLRTVLYLAKISTPPDPRWGNVRTFPPVGNTYRFETSVLFAIMAKLQRTRHPAEADALQWMWFQQGRPIWAVIGGNTALNQLTQLWIDETPPKGPPGWTSEVFPMAGTILRTGFPGPRETQLYMLQGPFDQHYDHDRGSITLWGKGWPLSLDWGYSGRMPADMHSMMNIGNRGRVTAFSAQPRTDYVHCDLGAWQRQVLFVKDADATGANYFLLRDSTAGRGTANWNLWLYTKDLLAREGDVVRMRGHGDVDLDVWLADKRAAVFKAMTAKEVRSSRPPEVKAARTPVGVEEARIGEEFENGPLAKKGPEYIKTREASVTCVAGYLKRGGWGYAALKQRALSLTVKRGETVFAVLYPRLHTEKAPVFRALADGRGVRVESAAGVDHAFLALKPFKFAAGDVAFEGTAGAVQVRGKTVTLTLGAAGTVSFRGQELKSDKPATKEVEVE